MLRRLLVPLDGSVTAEAALPYAERLARRTGAEILLARAIAPPPQSMFTPAPRPPEADEAAATEYLNTVAARPMFQDLRVNVRVVGGYPATAIAELARRRANTLVVMASHGYTAMRRTRVGSVADKVMHIIRVPVLLVPALATGLREPTRVLVGLDGSRRGEAVLPVATDVARALGLEVTLVHVLPASAPPEARAQARSYLEEVSVRISDGKLAATTEILEGFPADRLAEAAEGRDIIALASHGRTGINRWLLGSVAERVVDQATSPIILVRAPVERRVARGREMARREIAP